MHEVKVLPHYIDTFQSLISTPFLYCNVNYRSVSLSNWLVVVFSSTSSSTSSLLLAGADVFYLTFIEHAF